MASYKNYNTDLDKEIARLEVEREVKMRELKHQLAITYDSVKPINLLKETLDDFQNTPDVKANILQSTLSIAGGYLSKKLVMGKSNSIFKKIFGYVLQYGVTNFISKKVHTNQ